MKEYTELPWGRMRWLVTPEKDGVTSFCSCEVVMNPGDGHTSHRHPSQEEMVFVLEGEIRQTLEGEEFTMSVGDHVVIPAGAAHSSINVGPGEARALVLLTPAADAPNGYESEDVDGGAV